MPINSVQRPRDRRPEAGSRIEGHLPASDTRDLLNPAGMRDSPQVAGHIADRRINERVAFRNDRLPFEPPPAACLVTIAIHKVENRVAIVQGVGLCVRLLDIVRVQERKIALVQHLIRIIAKNVVQGRVQQNDPARQARDPQHVVAAKKEVVGQGKTRVVPV